MKRRAKRSSDILTPRDESEEDVEHQRVYWLGVGGGRLGAQLDLRLVEADIQTSPPRQSRLNLRVDSQESRRGSS